MQRPTLANAPVDLVDAISDDLDWWGHAPHTHDEPQLIYAASGSCVVEVADRSLRVDLGTAVWLAPGCEHSARFDDEFVPVSLLPAPHHPSAGPAGALTVDAALRTLLLRFARASDSIAVGQLAERIRSAPLAAAQATTVPLPRGPLTGPIVAAFEADPAHDNTLDEWASELHCSVTSLRRAFLAETGLSFTDWRTRFRIEQSIPLLERGAQVSLVAARVGMTHNGFTSAFRRTIGHTPMAHRSA